MEATKLTRRVYPNAQLKHGYIASSISFVPFSPGEVFETVPIKNISSYGAGCRVHASCFGHMCKTPSGNILPPQSLSMRQGPIVTEYLKAAKLAFESDKSRYIQQLRKTNYTKRGHLRSIMSTPVAGSCRLVAVPQFEFGIGCVALSKSLASKFVFCSVETSENGSILSTYKERTLQENDWVIAVRPPSLSYRNTQPMRVRFWDRDSVGIHPSAFSAFHGDYDGDELQLYAVTSPESIDECERWYIPDMPAFASGSKIMEEEEGVPQVTDEAKFLCYTTLSAKQMVEESHSLLLGDVSRNKTSHLKDMHERFNSEDTMNNFVAQSIRGTSDIVRQQLTQSSVGDMTRVAKTTASCFFRDRMGNVCVSTGRGNIVLAQKKGCDAGCPAVRAVTALCAVAQQSNLDAHRVGSSSSSGHDFVQDMFWGFDPQNTTDGRTLVILDKDTPNVLLNLPCFSWKYNSGLEIVTLVLEKHLGQLPVKYVIGSYNPAVLAMLDEQPDKLILICRRSIEFVCKFLRVMLTENELYDVSVMFSYQVSSSSYPVTSRKGCVERDLGWIEQLLATDYSKLSRLEGLVSTLETSTSAMFAANFNNIKQRCD